MNISDLKLVEKRHIFQHPEYPELAVDINYIARKDWESLRKNNEKKVYKKGTPAYELDEARFYTDYVKRVFNGWEGLTLGILKKFGPIETVKKMSDDTVIPFSAEIAEFIMKNSAEFDDWVTSLVSDLQNFEESQIEEAEKNSLNTSKKNVEE